MPGFSLQHIHVRAALQQVGKVGAGAAAAAAAVFDGLWQASSPPAHAALLVCGHACAASARPLAARPALEGCLFPALLGCSWRASSSWSALAHAWMWVSRTGWWAAAARQRTASICYHLPSRLRTNPAAPAWPLGMRFALAAQVCEGLMPTPRWAHTCARPCSRHPAGHTLPLRLRQGADHHRCARRRCGSPARGFRAECCICMDRLVACTPQQGCTLAGCCDAPPTAPVPSAHRPLQHAVRRAGLRVHRLLHLQPDHLHGPGGGAEPRQRRRCVRARHLCWAQRRELAGLPFYNQQQFASAWELDGPSANRRQSSVAAAGSHGSGTPLAPLQ